MNIHINLHLRILESKENSKYSKKERVPGNWNSSE
jgi:hypothetical protein